MEQNSNHPHVIELVVRNFGATSAVDVTITATPNLQRTGQGGVGVSDVWLPTQIPLLVPGQEWRTLWDVSWHRKESGLPNSHDVLVSYTDTHGVSYDSKAVLDWSAYFGRRWVETRGLHDLAEAARGIAKTHAKWQEDIHGGLAVWVRDGSERDAKRRAEFEAWRSTERPDSQSQSETEVDGAEVDGR